MGSLLKKRLYLEGLNCPNCASKMENKIKNVSGVRMANIDFVAKKLDLEIKSDYEINKVIEQVIDIIKNIEEDVRVIDDEIVHNHMQHYEESDNREIIRIVIGIVLYTSPFIFRMPGRISFIVYLISYIFIGEEVIKTALINIGNGQIFDENFLMFIATIGAIAIKQYPEAVAVMLFYQIGELFQDIAVDKSRKSISELINIRPEYANLKTGINLKKVSPEEVKVGDIIVIKPGERVPLDGNVLEGESMVDTSALTGESVPRKVRKNNEVLSGFINKNGLLTVRVTREYDQSAVVKILDLVQNASSKKAQTENFITSFARYYTPTVVLIALGIALIPPMLIKEVHFSQWLYRALIFLVVSCPCALVISIPLSFFGGIGAASKMGILVKGSNYLEALNKVETVIFDKTGTLTKGVFKVTKINNVHPFSQEEIIKYAAYAEAYSNHPIALSIQRYYEKHINTEDIKGYTEISGCGTIIQMNGKKIIAGNSKLMHNEKISNFDDNLFGTVVHIAVDKKYAGYIIISDELKKDSKRCIKELKSIGISKVIMLTGDKKSTAENVGKELEVDEVYSELLPHEKIEKLEQLKKNKSSKSKIVFVGDGINDAPVLAMADVGIAMGGLGSDAAIEASDIVIMTDEPYKVFEAIIVAQKTKAIVWENITFALGVKFAVLLLGAIGMASMWEAVFADAGVAVIAVLNAMRVLRVKPSGV